MATLVSPGVSVTVSDESFYSPAGAGSVPLIVIATAQDKASPDGSGTAAYTTSATADKLYRISSQRELLQNYGNPSFKSSGGTQLHGDELNEYGLLSAYSFLGIANSAYVLRANVDLDQLEASSTAPTTAPADGTYWLDLASTDIVLKQYDGSAYVTQTVKKPTANETELDGALLTPKASFGLEGDFASVHFETDGDTTGNLYVFEKTTSSTWHVVGSTEWDGNTSSADYQVGASYDLPTTRIGGGALVSGDVFLQTNLSGVGSDFAVKLYDAGTSQFTTQTVTVTLGTDTFYATNPTPAEGIIIFDLPNSRIDSGDDGTAFIVPKRHNGETITAKQSTAALSDTDIDLTNHVGDAVSFYLSVNTADNLAIQFRTDSDADGNASVDDMVQDINSAISAANAEIYFTDNVVASNVDGKITITCTDGFDIDVDDGNVSGFGFANVNLPNYTTNFEPLSYTASQTQITGTLANGTLWYDSVVSQDKIDILYNDASTGWEPYTGDVQLGASEPTKRSDNGSLVDGDIWVSTADLENYPLIYKWNATTSAWVLVDNTDQITPDGILFGDFRNSASSNVLISGAPNSALYPSNMIAYNKLLSGGNVKKWNSSTSLWEDYSGNKSDGSPYMLRKAQRAVIVRALQSSLTSNQEIRNEINRFNLLAVPGYPELADEMISLGVDRKNTIFSVIDSPLRLSADATSTQNWVTNANNAVENGEDGLLSSDPYAAVYYPSGLATNLDGSSVMVPSSYMALRTIAFNDQVAFPWFAPAGFQRGLVNNATSVGYLDTAENEFVPVSLSEGQRDGLYLNKINPIGNFPGRGLAVFGQKTLNPTSSALDRVNVARLVVYLREQLDDAVKPFLFEPNDEVTRANAKVVVDRLLGELVTQRGLFDFITVCDTTNNTPARIDRNELHIDIAIQPVKAVEFIYIPIRIQNTLGSTT